MKRRIWMYQLFFVMISLTGLSSLSEAMQLTSPNGGETWYKGSTYDITWTASGDRDIDIELMKDRDVYRTLARNVSTTTGRYRWLITPDIEPGTNYRMRIVQPSNTSNKDKSDNDFTIANAVPSRPSMPSRIQVPKKDLPLKQPGIVPKPKPTDPSLETVLTPCLPNYVGQPDLTGSPRWSSSSARFGQIVNITVPVDEDTGWVSVSVRSTRAENGVSAGLGHDDMYISPGSARTVTLSIPMFTTYGPDRLSGDYYPMILLCKPEGSCLEGINIFYKAPGTSVTLGMKYNREYNFGIGHVSNAVSCYNIPIITVTE